ncbi:MAG: hypothetical protein H0X13_17625 [Ramlibacter sp.]|nr:hypothetical protein [Ramlibacter sp.]
MSAPTTRPDHGPAHFFEIAGQGAGGKANPEIGCILQISEFTVKNCMRSIFSKLDVTHRAQAVPRLTRMSAHAA